LTRASAVLHGGWRPHSIEERNVVKLTLLGTESVHGDCPTLYATDRDTYVVQGLRVVDPEALAAMRIPAHETAVEIPRGLLRFVVPVEKSKPSDGRRLRR
jgi:hypothetical protein